MKINLSTGQIGILLLLLIILAGWSLGIAWLFEISWKATYALMLVTGIVSYLLHYYRVIDLLTRQLGARRIRSDVIDKLYRVSNLGRKPTLYVTDSLQTANAFTVTCAEEDAIYITPEIFRAREEIQAPILAHEMAHIQQGDSFLMGFVSVFEQMMGNFGNLWLLVTMAGPVGCVLVLFFWPILLFLYSWSVISLTIYQPLAAILLRQREFKADRKAAQWTSVPLMVKALQSIEHYNQRWFPNVISNQQGPLSTHPPLESRIDRLKNRSP